MINSYLILQNGEETGPFTLYELMDHGVEVHTMVLSPLANDWQEASDLPEFQKYFAERGVFVPRINNMAGFWWRLLAYVIDYMVTLLIYSAIDIVLGAVLPFLGIGSFFNTDDFTLIQIISNLLALIFTLSYHSVCEATPMQGSIGKVILKIAVVDVNGRRLSFGNAAGRNLGKIGSGAVLGIGYLSIFWDEHKQAWHDHWAKAYVIRKG